MDQQTTADFLVIGSGIAGLRAAITLQAHGQVLLLTKSDPDAGSTGHAQGGIAAAVGPDDSPERHLADTLEAGDGLCVEEAARVLVEQGPAYVQELLEWGVSFDRRPDGHLDLAREGAHSVRRVLHARDATGREISRALASRLRPAPSVTVMDHVTAQQALVEDGRVVGVRCVDRNGQVMEARARATLLATGGAGRLFRETTNPPVACGDGVTLAFLAGARVTDLEFVQFHPTALAVPGQPRFLLSEALRGEGARLVNADGEAFMVREDPAGDLAPRDRVSRAIVRESRRTGAPVYLTLEHLPAEDVRARFPLIADLCRRVGLDLATDRLPVSPAAHYVMGGVVTDLVGRTSLPGLYAAGEVACTGVHGANRLASNSLLEGLVFGGRAAAAMCAAEAERWPNATAPRPTGPRTGSTATVPLGRAVIADLMWQHVGVFRDRAGLETALAILEPAWRDVDEALAGGADVREGDWQAVSLVTIGRLVARAALRREESRGGHWRTDFPARDDLHWCRHLTDCRE